MDKPTFLSHTRPILTAMIQQPTPEDCITGIRNAIFDGADALGVQLCEIKPQYRTEAEYKRIFSYAGHKPIYITNYRARESAGMTDEALLEEQLVALKAGAVLCDVMGDQFDPSPFELSRSPAAIKKQRAFIDRVHALGKEVLMSSHIKQFLPEAQVLDIVKQQEDRGADIAKIVTCVNTEEEMLANFHTMLRMKEALSIPFLFLANGAYCKLQRIIGPAFGSSMLLCVHHYENHTSKEQPILRAARDVMMNIDWEPYRPQTSKP